MKFFINLFIVLFTILLFTASLLYAQSEEEDWSCGFADAPEKQELLESLTTLQDTTLKVGLLLVQFADWQDSLDSRGSVGWSLHDTTGVPNRVIWC